MKASRKGIYPKDDSVYFRIPLMQLMFTKILLIAMLRLYVFGGNDIRFGPMNNLWCFDLQQIGDLPELCKYKNQSQDYPMSW